MRRWGEAEVTLRTNPASARAKLLQAEVTEVASCPKKKLRAKLIAEGKVKNGVFTEDVPFTSKSGAAGCVLGASVDGVKAWK